MGGEGRHPESGYRPHLPARIGREPALYWGTMTDEEMAEVIALCEDPNEDFSDVRGRPPTPEEIAMVTSIADGIFFRLSPEKQVDNILRLPTHASARLLAQMPTSDREHMLSLLPSPLSEDIHSLLPMGSV